MWSGDNPTKDGVAQSNNYDTKRDGQVSDSNNARRGDRQMGDSSDPSNDTRKGRERSLSEDTRQGSQRSLSVPCRSQTSEVETVMTKAKRASLYLWMLLHSQNCRLGVDRCTRPGCADAKLTHLHLKTCPAGGDFPCPTRYTGCLQARKLLAHYRQCRKIRARQATQAPSVKGQHVCLICSMVARQARSLLDNNMQCSKPSASAVVAHKKSSANAKCQVVSSFTVKASINSSVLSASFSGDSRRGKRNIISSFTLSPGSGSAKFFPRKSSQPGGDWGMPPPAPRAKSAPSSPMGPERPELKSKNGTSLDTMPLFRKRSESLGCEPGRRAVSFAPRPQCLDRRPDSLFGVELLASDPSESAPVQRGRSASCHQLSAPTGNSSDCGTIYEEIGPAASCMEE